MKWMRVGCGLLLAAVLSGCQSQLAEENRSLWAQNRQLQSRLGETDGKLKAAPDPSQLTALQTEIAQRDARIKELETQLRQPTPGGNEEPGISGIQTSYDAKAGTMTVTLPGDVLFQSGSATLKGSSLSTLKKIAAALNKDYANRAVRVQGHTDSDPITKTRDQWSDNLDLSLSRAAAVTRYLENQGVSPKLITTSGLGANHPKGNKNTSRRVEIVVVVK